MIFLEQTESTNADALRLAKRGEKLPLWVVAERQTAGRGRDGRIWISEPGNLHASVAFEARAPLSAASQLALVAGIALYESVQTVVRLAGPQTIRLKWPNDLLIGSAKAGGILVETIALTQEQGVLAVIGFGLNVSSAPQGTGREVSCLADVGDVPPVPELANVLAGEVDRWIGVWDAGRNFSAVRGHWLSRGTQPGERISLHTHTGKVSGTFAGLGADGALLIETANGVESFTYGDAVLGTPAARGPAQ